MYGSDTILPLERLQSAGDESLERIQPLPPVQLLDTTDTMCSKSPCHQPFSASEQRLDTQDNFSSSRQGLTVYEVLEEHLDEESSHSAVFLFFQGKWEEGASPGIPTHAPVTPLRDGGLRISPPERTVSTACKFPATKTLSTQSLADAQSYTHVHAHGLAHKHAQHNLQSQIQSHSHSPSRNTGSTTP